MDYQQKMPISRPNPLIQAQYVAQRATCDAALWIQYIKKDIKQVYEFIISIENEISVVNEKVSDICQVRIEDRWGRTATGSSFYIDVDSQYYHQAVASTPSDYCLMQLGLPITIGQMISKKYPSIDHQNWMPLAPAGASFGGSTFGG